MYYSFWVPNNAFLKDVFIFLYMHSYLKINIATHYKQSSMALRFVLRVVSWILVPRSLDLATDRCFCLSESMQTYKTSPDNHELWWFKMHKCDTYVRQNGYILSIYIQTQFTGSLFCGKLQWLINLILQMEKRKKELSVCLFTVFGLI